MIDYRCGVVAFLRKKIGLFFKAGMMKNEDNVFTIHTHTCKYTHTCNHMQFSPVHLPACHTLPLFGPLLSLIVSLSLTHTRTQTHTHTHTHTHTPTQQTDMHTHTQTVISAPTHRHAHLRTYSPTNSSMVVCTWKERGKPPHPSTSTVQGSRQGA